MLQIKGQLQKQRYDMIIGEVVVKHVRVFGELHLLVIAQRQPYLLFL